MAAEVLYDFDDVIDIVNGRHETLKFNAQVKEHCKKEREQMEKEKIHRYNKTLIHWLSNAGYALAGGGVVWAFACASAQHYGMNLIASLFASAALLAAIYFDRRHAQYD